jgi:hypothetical protein
LLAVILEAAIEIDAAVLQIRLKGDWNEIAVPVEMNPEVTIIDCDTLMSINGFMLVKNVQSLPPQRVVRLGERPEI